MSDFIPYLNQSLPTMRDITLDAPAGGGSAMAAFPPQPCLPMLGGPIANKPLATAIAAPIDCRSSDSRDASNQPSVATVNDGSYALPASVSGVYRYSSKASFNCPPSDLSY